MKIDLPLIGDEFWPMSSAVTETVEIVDVAPHLASRLTFALGRHPEDKRVWRLHNLETGFALTQADATTKAECLRIAKKHLQGVPLTRAVRRLQEIAKTHPDTRSA